MEMQTTSQIKVYEQKLIGILRKLPPERVFQVIDFARFIESRTTGTSDDDLTDKDESEEEIAAENARWDKLWATDESQRLLEKMADEALADIQAGHARPMVFTKKGEIAPG